MLTGWALACSYSPYKMLLNSDIKSPERSQCPESARSHLLHLLRRLLDAPSIFFSLIPFLARPPRPSRVKDWHCVNAGQLATAVYCHQLLTLAEAIASFFYTSIYFLSLLSAPSLIFTRSRSMARVKRRHINRPFKGLLNLFLITTFFFVFFAFDYPKAAITLVELISVSLRASLMVMDCWEVPWQRAVSWDLRHCWGKTGTSGLSL